MKVVIGSDKSGFHVKEAIKAYLQTANIVFDDLGTIHEDQAMPYYAAASKIAPLVQEGAYDRAILICGTGAGMSIVANKYKGIHAVACESVYSARMARAINGANVLCMGGWIVGPEMAIEMTKAFLTTEWLENLEDWRQENLKKFNAQVGAIEDDIYGE